MRRARSCAAFAPRPERTRPRSRSGHDPQRRALSARLVDLLACGHEIRGSSRSSYGHDPRLGSRQDLGHHGAARDEQSLEAPLDLLAAEGLADGSPHRDVVERRDTEVRHERDRRCARFLAIAVAVLRANLGQQIRGSRLLHDVQRPRYHGPRLLLGEPARRERSDRRAPATPPERRNRPHRREDHPAAGAHVLDPVGPDAGQRARRALRLRGSLRQRRARGQGENLGEGRIRGHEPDGDPTRGAVGIDRFDPAVEPGQRGSECAAPARSRARSPRPDQSAVRVVKPSAQPQPVGQPVVRYLGQVARQARDQFGTLATLGVANVSSGV